MKHKKQNMNIIKHIEQNIKSGNHKKVAKFGSLTFFCRKSGTNSQNVLKKCESFVLHLQA